MSKYKWILIVVLMGLTGAFIACERIPTMMDTVLPDAE